MAQVVVHLVHMALQNHVIAHIIVLLLMVEHLLVHGAIQGITRVGVY